jgi:hypothetical protein
VQANGGMWGPARRRAQGMAFSRQQPLPTVLYNGLSASQCPAKMPPFQLCSSQSRAQLHPASSLHKWGRAS